MYLSISMWCTSLLQYCIYKKSVQWSAVILYRIIAIECRKTFTVAIKYEYFKKFFWQNTVLYCTFCNTCITLTESDCRNNYHFLHVLSIGYCVRYRYFKTNDLFIKNQAVGTFFPVFWEEFKTDVFGISANDYDYLKKRQPTHWCGPPTLKTKTWRWGAVFSGKFDLLYKEGLSFLERS